MYISCLHDYKVQLFSYSHHYAKVKSRKGDLDFWIFNIVLQYILTFQRCHHVAFLRVYII